MLYTIIILQQYNFLLYFAATCHLSRKEISTFDNMSYRPVMGQCWHIMSATTDQSSVTIPLVLIKDNYKKGIFATVIARYGARFNFRNEDGALLLLLGSKPILSTSRASAYVGYRLRIWSTPTTLKLITDDNNFEFTYTGSTVEVKVSKKNKKKHSNKSVRLMCKA